MRIKILGLALAVFMGFGALSAAGASASVWRNADGTEITSPVAYEAEGTIELEEQHFGNSYSCPFRQEGTVGAGAVGTITGKKVFKCTYLHGAPCEEAIEVEPTHLPWATQLATINNLLRNEFKSGGSGAPGWKIKCTKQGGEKRTEECPASKSTTASTALMNVTGGVKATFDSGSSFLCNIGTLVFRGSEVIKKAGGGVLRVQNPEWLLNGTFIEKPVTVQSKGTLKFRDAGSGGKTVFECTSTGEGPVEPGSVRELTKLTLTGCKSVEGTLCESSGLTVEARDLPWRTVLVTSEGTTRELISEGGKGAPGLKTKCKYPLIGTAEDECTGNTSAAVKTITGGVDEIFDTHSEKLSCTLGGAGQGTIEGTSLLENPASGKLTFTP
jgi:hypothetical protein